MPTRIQFGAGNSISYLYDADGVKLRTTYVIDGVTSVTDYCSNAIYENGIATCLLTEAGYISLNDQVYHYHLRNVYKIPGILQDNGRFMRESLLMGPNGGLNVQSIWENNRLITVELFGGK